MRTSILTLALSIIFFGCSKNNDSFDENIKITMYESIDSTQRNLILNCKTERIFNCGNYSIQKSVSIKNNKITIRFIQIETPSICLTSVEPAFTSINLGNLPNNNYEIEFDFGGSIIDGTINVSNGIFDVTLPTQNRVKFTNLKLNRIPNNTIFGTIHYHSTTTEILNQNFIDSLQILGATNSSYNPGDYVHFEIQQNGEVLQRQDLGYYYTRYFIFNYNNSSENSRRLVKNFGLRYPDLLSITLNTTKGEIFYSWN